MKEQLVKLLTVKSIVTVITTAVFAKLAWTGQISVTLFLTIYMSIISFYFGTQHEKKTEIKKLNEEE